MLTKLGLGFLMVLFVASSYVSASERVIYLTGPHGQEMIDFMHQIGAEFTAETGIEVEIWSVPGGQTVDRLLGMLAGGTPPDLAHLANQDAFMFASQGLLEDLRPYYARDGIDLSVVSIPPVVEAVDWEDGSTYLIPVAAQARGNFFNKDHFDAAALPTPHALKADNNWTWESVIDISTRLTRRDPEGILQQAAIWMSDNWTEWQTYVWQAGGDAFDRTVNPTRGTFLSDPPRQALNWVLDLWHVSRVTPSYTDRPLQSGNWFFNGTASMFIWGQPGHIPRIHESIGQGTWDVAPHFTGPASDISYLALNTMQIPRDSRNKEAAWQFAKYIAFRTESMRLFSELTGRTPALRDAFPSYVETIGAEPPSAHIFVDNLFNVRHGPIVSKDYDEINRVLLPLYRGALRGEHSPESALQQMQWAVDGILGN